MASNTAEYNRIYARKRRKRLKREKICPICAVSKAKPGCVSCQGCIDRSVAAVSESRRRASELEVVNS